MKHRSSFVVVLSLSWVQAAFATTSYSFGNVQPFDLYNGITTSIAGVWTETIAPGVTSQSIVCVNAVANISNICGNPGPDDSVSISLPSAPGGTLPVGTTNYLMVDGDNRYGAPVSTSMTGLIVNATYQVSFYQASSEETGNNQQDTDRWQVYIIPGATTGVYICPTCSTPVNPLPADLAYTSTAIINPGGPSSTPWQLQTFTFTATTATELLEFVTDNIATLGGGVLPPLIALADVTTSQVTPEPGTWVMMLVGGGLLLAGCKLRRRSSTAYKRVLEAPVGTKG